MVTTKKVPSKADDSIKMPAPAKRATKTDATPAKTSHAVKVTASAKSPVSGPKSTVVPKKKKPAVEARSNSNSKPDHDRRLHYIQVAAYYIAERAGFSPTTAHDNWLAAEAESDRLIAEGQLEL